MLKHSDHTIATILQLFYGLDLFVNQTLQELRLLDIWEFRHQSTYRRQNFLADIFIGVLQKVIEDVHKILLFLGTFHELDV